MYNKVRQNEKSLIDETIAQLQMLKVRINRGNDEIMQIDKDISVLLELFKTHIKQEQM